MCLPADHTVRAQGLDIAREEKLAAETRAPLCLLPVLHQHGLLPSAHRFCQQRVLPERQSAPQEAGWAWTAYDFRHIRLTYFTGQDAFIGGAQPIVRGTAPIQSGGSEINATLTNDDGTKYQITGFAEDLNSRESLPRTSSPLLKLSVWIQRKLSLRARLRLKTMVRLRWSSRTVARNTRYLGLRKRCRMAMLPMYRARKTFLWHLVEGSTFLSRALAL